MAIFFLFYYYFFFNRALNRNTFVFTVRVRGSGGAARGRGEDGGGITVSAGADLLGGWRLGSFPLYFLALVLKERLLRPGRHGGGVWLQVPSPAGQLGGGGGGVPPPPHRRGEGARSHLLGQGITPPGSAHEGLAGMWCLRGRGVGETPKESSRLWDNPDGPRAAEPAAAGRHPGLRGSQTPAGSAKISWLVIKGKAKREEKKNQKNPQGAKASGLLFIGSKHEPL